MFISGKSGVFWENCVEFSGTTGALVVLLSAHYNERVAAQVWCRHQFKSGVCIFGPDVVTFALTKSDQAAHFKQ